MNDARHAAVGVHTQFVFPQSQDTNAGPLEFRSCSVVSKAIALNFGLPEAAVGSGYMATTRATVPKAAINKYRDMLSAKIEIWAPQNVFRRNLPAVNSGPYQSKSQFAFGGFIAAAFDRSHVTGTFCRDTNKPAARQLMAKDSLHDFSFSADAKKINSAWRQQPRQANCFNLSNVGSTERF